MRVPGVITRNFRLKVGCTVLALITWVGVVYAGNPPETRLIMVHVPQQRSAIPAKFVLVHPVPDIPVRIGGARDRLNSFSPDMLTLSVAWSHVTKPGVQIVPVSLSNSAPNIEVIDPPTSITADVDYEDSTTVPVTIVVTNPPPAGYNITSQTADPDAVVVSGPHRELSGLQARVNVDLGNNKTNFLQITPVLLYDAQGNRLSDLTVTPPPGSNASPGTVTVTIIVSANVTSRAAAVLPSTTGTVAAGHVFAGIVVSPATVVLSGPQNLLNALDAVGTTTISLNGLTSSQTIQVSLRPPAGVTASPGSVSVTILVNPVAPSPTASPSPTPTPT